MTRCPGLKAPEASGKGVSAGIVDLSPLGSGPASGMAGRASALGVLRAWRSGGATPDADPSTPLACGSCSQKFALECGFRGFILEHPDFQTPSRIFSETFPYFDVG